MEKLQSIVFIAPSLQMGGIERSMSTFANYFVSQSIKVHYITLFPFEPFFELDSGIIRHFSPFHFPRFGRSAIQTLTYYIRMLSPFNGHIKHVVKTVKPDVIVCFGDWFPHLVMLQLKSLNIPLFYGNRSNPAIRYTLLQEFFRTMAYHLAPPKGIVAQTTEAYLRKRRIVGSKIPIEIIPNPVRKITDKGIEKENWIISVGRMHLDKGFVRLMECFRDLESKADWKLVLVGTGVHESEIKEMAKKFGIFDKTIFTGKVTDIDTLLLKSRIFVLSSYKEGYPNALCEAMSAGLACLSFDIVAGPKDIIQNEKNGYLIPNNDLKLMTEKIDFLIKNPASLKRIGTEAQRITESNSIESIGQKLLNFISSTI